MAGTIVTALFSFRSPGQTARALTGESLPGFGLRNSMLQVQLAQHSSFNFASRRRAARRGFGVRPALRVFELCQIQIPRSGTNSEALTTARRDVDHEAGSRAWIAGHRNPAAVQLCDHSYNGQS